MCWLPAGRAEVAILQASPSGAPITSLSLQQASHAPWLAAASVRGDIRVFDPRAAASGLDAAAAARAGALHAVEGHRSGLSAIALHAAAPLLASGSRNQLVKLFDLSALRAGGAARETHTIRYFDGFLGARIGPVTSLCFHPSKVMLAVGATDSVISLFGTPLR